MTSTRPATMAQEGRKVAISREMLTNANSWGLWQLHPKLNEGTKRNGYALHFALHSAL